MIRNFLIFTVFFLHFASCFAKPVSIDDTLAKKALVITLDEQDKMILEQRSPTTLQRINEGKSLSIYDVIQISQSGISDDIIINYMNETKSKYRLNQAQIYRMQNSGVSQRVINYMIDTGY